MPQLPEHARLAFEKGFVDPVPYALPYHLAEHRAQVAWVTMEHDLETAVTEALEGMAVQPEQVLPEMARWVNRGRPERALRILATALAQGTAVGERRLRRRIYALVALLGVLGVAGAGVTVATVLRVWGVL